MNLKNIRVNEEGTIDIQYMAKLGDDALFLGSRPLRLGGGMIPAETTDAVMATIFRGRKTVSFSGRHQVVFDFTGARNPC